MTNSTVIKVEAKTDHVAVTVKGKKGTFLMFTTPIGTSVTKIGAERVAASIRSKGVFNINHAQTQSIDLTK